MTVKRKPPAYPTRASVLADRARIPNQYGPARASSFPFVYSLADSNGFHPWEDSRLRLGDYLMLVSMAGPGPSQPEVPVAVMGLMLLFATNSFSPLTPQASSANAIFVDSGYLSGGEGYRYGGLDVVMCLLLYLGVGTPWLPWPYG